MKLETNGKINTAERLITVAEAAKILKLAPKTVYNRKGETSNLLRIRQGRTVRLLLDEVIQHQEEKIRQAENLYRLIHGN